jgi:hypothetical protein
MEVLNWKVLRDKQATAHNWKVLRGKQATAHNVHT